VFRHQAPPPAVARRPVATARLTPDARPPAVLLPASLLGKRGARASRRCRAQVCTDGSSSFPAGQSAARAPPACCGPARLAATANQHTCANSLPHTRAAAPIVRRLCSWLSNSIAQLHSPQWSVLCSCIPRDYDSVISSQSHLMEPWFLTNLLN